MNLVQKYKLATLKVARLAPWYGDWAKVVDDDRLRLIASRWRMHARMTWSEKDEVEAWERARKVATA